MWCGVSGENVVNYIYKLQQHSILSMQIQFFLSPAEHAIKEVGGRKGLRKMKKETLFLVSSQVVKYHQVKIKKMFKTNKHSFLYALVSSLRLVNVDVL